MSKLPISELKKLTTAVASGAVATFGILEDGKVGFGDIKHVPSVISALRNVSAVDFKAILPQLDDMDAAEADELAAHFKAEFKIADTAKEKVIEQGFEYLLVGVRAVAALVEMGRNIAGKKE